MTLTLYFASGSCSLASQIALEEAGAIYQRKALLLSAAEHKNADYLAINPHGRIPALLVEKTPITETIAILSYVAHRFPASGLLPLDHPLLLARAYERMSWYATSLHIAIAQIWRTERFASQEAAWPAIREGGRASLEKGFQEIDDLMDGPWVLGDRYSVVDGYTQVFWRWGERLGMDMPRYARWAAQSNRLLDRPAVIRALAAEKGTGEAGTGAN